MKEPKKSKKEGTKITEGSSEMVLVKIVEETEYRVKQSINDWIVGEQMAKSLILPNYVPLYMLFGEIAKDGHVTGVWQQRVMRLLSKKARMVDSSGKEDAAATNIFRQAWFYKFISLSMDSIPWHHSLIQLWDKTDLGYKVVQLVNRNHVLPREGKICIRRNDTTTTIDYRDPLFYDWLIEVGDPDDLGLYNKVAPNYLIKKNALQEWSKYTQIFGMPLRKGTTSSRVEADVQKMANNLKNMQNAQYVVLREGENVEFIESTKGDAYQVFKELILLPNSEISKIFLGSTMTVDNGSSRSQSEVHERVADYIAEADEQKMAFLVNDELLPRMIKHGFKLEGLRFEWEPTKDTKGMLEVVKALLPHKNVDNSFIETNFGVKVTDKETTPADPNNNPNPQPDPATPVKKKSKPGTQLSITQAIDVLYSAVCGHGHVHLAADEEPPLPIDIDALAKFIYDNQDANGVIHNDTYLRTANQLLSGFRGGYKGGFEAQGATEMRAKIAGNLYTFSAAKTLTQMNEMRDLVIKDGKVLGYTEFRKEVDKLGIKYNQQHLKVEYNNCIASGQSGRIWDELQSTKDLYPCAEIHTAGDERVREDHRKYEGLVIRLDSPTLKWFWPPFDWACRCTATASDAQPTAKLPEGLKNTVPPLFRNNVGVTKVVFNDTHPAIKTMEQIVKNEPGKVLNYKNYNLKPLGEINRLNKPAPASIFTTKDEFKQWVTDNKPGKAPMQIDAFDGETHILSGKRIDHVGKNDDGNHWQYTPNLFDMVKNPSECYQLDIKGTLTRSFLKHYKDYTQVCVSTLDKDNGWSIQTWYKWDGVTEIEHLRQGALLWLNR